MPTVTVVLLFGLVAASATDVLTRRLPDFLTIPLTGAGLLITWVSSPSDVLAHFIAAAVAYSSLWLVARGYRVFRGRDGLGLGDAKLLAAAGAWLGPLFLAPVVLIGTVLALLFVLARHLFGRQISSQTTLPFGPFLSIGFFGCWCIKLGGGSIFG